MTYVLLLPLSLCFNLLAYFLAPVLPLFASKEGWLPKWLWWFQTPDNSLDGDDGWKTEHWQWRFRLSKRVSTYVGRVGWLWRNPAYGFEWDGPLCARISSEDEVTWSGDPGVQNRPNGKEGYCFTRVGPYWSLVYVKRLSAATCFYLCLGWKLKTYAEDPSRVKSEPKAQFVFSPRLSEFKNASINA